MSGDSLHVIVRLRYVVLALFGLLCLWLIPGIANIENDDDVLAFLPPDHPEVINFHEVADKFGMSIEQVLRELIDAGLGSLPGGGAEIFADRVRRKICSDKASAEQWLEVHRTAHRLGLRSNCTMLYGHVETAADRIAHLTMLRDQQDRSGGFRGEKKYGASANLPNASSKEILLAVA